MAFTIGLGDLITALIASDMSDGVMYNIGSIYGSGLFVGCCVLSGSIFVNKGDFLTIEKMIVRRDLTFYIFTTLFVLFCGYLGEITLTLSLFFILIYICQVVFVIIREQREKNGGNLFKRRNQYAILDDTIQSITLRPMLNNNLNNNNNLNDSTSSERLKTDEYGAIKHNILDYPFLWISWITITPPDKVAYSKIRCLIFTIFGTFFLIGAKCNFNYTRNLIYVGLGLSLVMLVLFLVILPTGQGLPGPKT